MARRAVQFTDAYNKAVRLNNLAVLRIRRAEERAYGIYVRTAKKSRRGSAKESEAAVPSGGHSGGESGA